MGQYYGVQESIGYSLAFGRIGGTDTLFAMVNLGRFLEIDVEHSLRKAANKFVARFDYITENIEKKKDITKASLEEMEALWKEAKANLKR